MTQAGYSLLGRHADHPVLSELVASSRQEGRHIDFYSSQARERLNASERAQRLVRFALQRFWKPVGTGVMPEAETRFLARYLMTDEAGREAARRIDRLEWDDLDLAAFASRPLDHNSLRCLRYMHDV